MESRSVGSDVARRLFNGTLHGRVTKTAPSKYSRPPASTQTADGRPHSPPVAIPNPAKRTAVPTKTTRNTGLITTTLIDFIAAIASNAGSRRSAFITKLENA